MEQEEAVNKLKNTLDSSGWQELIKPAALQVRQSYCVGIINGEFREAPTAQGQPGRIIPDAELRAVIKVLDWLLSWETRYDAAAKELAFAAQQQLALDAAPETVGGSPTAPQAE